MIRALILCLLMPLAAGAETMRMAVTTSFESSGLADVLLPAIREDTGIDVLLLVVGTGQALRLGASGDVDAVLVHSRAAEDAFVAAGHAPYRREVMWNDFVVIGPEGDPAGAGAAADAAGALVAVAGAGAPFVSRGDDSGTHRVERALWAKVGADPEDFGPWYREIGAGMGAALNAAAAMGAYTLSDRGSWLAGPREGLAIAFEGDPALANQYAYLPIDPGKGTHVAAEAAARLEDWLTGPRARALIDGHRVGGERLFAPGSAP